MIKINRVLLIVGSVYLLILLASASDTKDDEWLVHKKKFNLTFKSQSDELKKLQTFKLNKKLIEKHNNDSSVTFKLKVNSRSHFSTNEFKNNFLLKVNLTQRLINKKNEYLNRLSIAKQFITKRTSKKSTTTTKIKPRPLGWNWVEKGIVGPVLNQLDCGCCYAFVTSGLVESAYALKTSRLLSLSKQQIVDCTKNAVYENLGCNGGYITTSLQYTIDRGLVEENDYPYKNKLGNCSNKYYQEPIKISRYGEIGFMNSDRMIDSILKYGPLIAYVSASSPYFQMYASGVLDDTECVSYGVDHVVLIVGFGYDNVSNKDYWIVKNSWGTDWGENGYMKVSRGKNICGIESDTYFAIY